MMSSDKHENIKFWFPFLIIAHIVQYKQSLFNIRSSVETIQGPPFYQQIAGTVILCDVSISMTSTYSEISDLDLNCRTLFDNTLPPATPEQLGELQQNLQFVQKIGSQMIKIDLDLAFESTTGEVNSNQVSIEEPISGMNIVNLVYVATASSSSSSSVVSSSSSRVSVKTSSSSSFVAHTSSSLSSSSSSAVTVCDGCNCPMEVVMDPDDTASRTLTVESPDYPYYYPNNAECTWYITATYGQLHMVFSKFVVQSDSTCSKDYLQISGPIKKYRRARICGWPIPNGFSLASKKSKLVLRFRSDSSIRKSGFRALILATGSN